MADPPRGDILVVDDTPANLRLLGELLGERGFRVRPVISGAQALRAAEAAVPELVLLDVHMPGMDGYEVCRRLKAAAATRDVPVIFLSARNESLDKVEAFSAGGVDYITKPFDIDEAVARIETHLALQRLRGELVAERAKSDALVSRMLPEPIAAALRQGERPPGQRYAGVTILVCDIVDFAELAARRSPEQVFELLDRLFTAFDAAAARLGVYKVETTGDSYVAVGGVEGSASASADAVAELALAMVEVADGFEVDGTRLAVRVGLHSGDVVGGVVGADLPRFCLFGGAMALAAQINGASLPQKVHLSEACARRLTPGRYAIQQRGTMIFRGAGAVETAFLRRRADAAE
ncbi:MAG: response regulator [Myxococcales bacterium]|nr:response regulator [Myxococcales bacterium]